MAIQSIFGVVDRLKADLENLSIDELKRERETRDDLLLLDIREIQETIDLGTIPGAIHVPRGMLEFWADPKSPYFRDYFDERKRIVVFCAGGDGPSQFDALGTLDAWMETGKPPESIVAARMKDGAVDRTRPLCPYPKVAVYRGDGSTDDAVNFTCALDAH